MEKLSVRSENSLSQQNVKSTLLVEQRGVEHLKFKPCEVTILYAYRGRFGQMSAGETTSWPPAFR